VGKRGRTLAGFRRLGYVTRRHDSPPRRARDRRSARWQPAHGLCGSARPDLDFWILGRRGLRRCDRSRHLDIRCRRGPRVRNARAALGSGLDRAGGRRPADSEPGVRSASAPRSSARLSLPQDGCRARRPLEMTRVAKTVYVVSICSRGGSAISRRRSESLVLRGGACEDRSH